MEKPLILLTNDDGYDSPGLLAAAAVLGELGDLLIVAPLVQQSGMGRAWPHNTSGAVYLREVQVGGLPHPAYAVDGSPSQAVAHGLLRITPRRPDLAVSGINYGENLGSVVTSSGTVGAAIEASISGIPSIAVSLEVDRAFYHSNSDQVDFGAAAHFADLFARRLLSTPLPPDVDMIKIEVPCDATPETPWEMTRLSRHRYFVAQLTGNEPLGEPVKLNTINDPSPSEPGTDTYALAYGRRVAVTPMSFDLTSRVDLDSLKQLLSNGDTPSPTQLLP